MTVESLYSAIHSSISTINQSLPLLGQAFVNADNHESILTSIADIALVTSVLKRDIKMDCINQLAINVDSLLDYIWTVRAFEEPGPEVWAKYASRIWLNPLKEKDKLKKSQSYRYSLEASAEIVLSLGPSWRILEVQHIFTKLGKSLLNRDQLMTLCENLIAKELNGYEITHIIFFTTDFGRYHLSNNLAEVCKQNLYSYLNNRNIDYDLRLELLLAFRYIHGYWAPVTNQWLTLQIPKWLSDYYNSPERMKYSYFIRYYHPLLISMFVLSNKWYELTAL